MPWGFWGGALGAARWAHNPHSSITKEWTGPRPLAAGEGPASSPQAGAMALTPLLAGHGPGCLHRQEHAASITRPPSRRSAPHGAFITGSLGTVRFPWPSAQLRRESRPRAGWGSRTRGPAGCSRLGSARAGLATPLGPGLPRPLPSPVSTALTAACSADAPV